MHSIMRPHHLVTQPQPGPGTCGSLVHRHVHNGLQAGREAQHNGTKQRAPAGGHKLQLFGGGGGSQAERVKPVQGWVWESAWPPCGWILQQSQSTLLLHASKACRRRHPAKAQSRTAAAPFGTTRLALNRVS